MTIVMCPADICDMRRVTVILFMFCILSLNIPEESYMISGRKRCHPKRTALINFILPSQETETASRIQNRRQWQEDFYHLLYKLRSRQLCRNIEAKFLPLPGLILQSMLTILVFPVLSKQWLASHPVVLRRIIALSHQNSTE